jgi:NAD(P)-dependent dehydrogenase (short-subunit alcohol dehydrogenase family)
MAKCFVENGAKVYVVSRKAQACDTVTDGLNKLPGKTGVAVSMPADVGSDENCKALAAKIASLEDKVDVLVNNAGITWGDDFEDHPEAAWAKLYNLNVTSIFNLTRAFRPLLIKASKGNLDPSKVINVSSVAGNMDSSNPMDNAPSYAVSKAAANKVTQVLASYLVKDGDRSPHPPTALSPSHKRNIPLFPVFVFLN